MKRKDNKIKCLNENQLKKYRCGLENYVGSDRWKYFVTLTFSYEIRDSLVASHIVKKFINVLSALAFGKRSKKRVNVFPFAETHKSGGLHIHLLIEDVVARIENKNRASQFDVKESVAMAWMNCSSKTTHPKATSGYEGRWFQEIYDVQGLLHYVTKDVVDKQRDPALYECVSVTGRRK